MRGTLRDLGISEQQVDEAFDATAERKTEQVDFELEESLHLHRKLAAKCALAAGVAVEPEFIDSAMADALRDVIHEPGDGDPDPDDRAVAVRHDERDAVLRERAAELGVAPVATRQAENQVTFHRLGGGRTRVLARVAGQGLLASLEVPGTPPEAGAVPTTVTIFQSDEGKLKVHRPELELALRVTGDAS